VAAVGQVGTLATTSKVGMLNSTGTAGSERNIGLNSAEAVLKKSRLRCKSILQDLNFEISQIRTTLGISGSF
jgi:hypothetical protein